MCRREGVFGKRLVITYGEIVEYFLVVLLVYLAVIDVLFKRHVVLKEHLKK